jgi:hypothetical protein
MSFEPVWVVLESVAVPVLVQAHKDKVDLVVYWVMQAVQEVGLVMQVGLVVEVVEVVPL